MTVYMMGIHFLPPSVVGAVPQKFSATDEKRIIQECQTGYRRGELQTALATCHEALYVAKVVGDHRAEAVMLNDIGEVHSALGENQPALEYLERALAMDRAIGDHSLEVSVLNNLGEVQSAMGQSQTGLDYLQQALAIGRKTRNKTLEGTTLGNIGAVHSALGEKQQALEYYNQALALQTAAGDHRGEATTLNNIGSVHSALGEKQKALEYYNDALSLQKGGADRRGEGTTLNNIGEVYSALGQKQKALEYCIEALSMQRAVGDLRAQATTLNNIGNLEAALGEKQKAVEYLQQAVAAERVLGDRRAVTTTSNNIEHLSRPSNGTLLVKTIVYLIVWIFGLIVAFVAWIWRLWNHRGSSTWPVTEGRIECRSVAQDSKGKTFACRLGYSYTVEGDYYSGFVEKVFKSEARAFAFRDQIKDRQPVVIRYDRKNPETSVLDLPQLELHRAAAAVKLADNTTRELHQQVPQPKEPVTTADGSSVARVIGEVSTLPDLVADSSESHPQLGVTTETSVSAREIPRSA